MKKVIIRYFLASLLFVCNVILVNGCAIGPVRPTDPEVAARYDVVQNKSISYCLDCEGAYHVILDETVFPSSGKHQARMDAYFSKWAVDKDYNETKFPKLDPEIWLKIFEKAAKFGDRIYTNRSKIPLYVKKETKNCGAFVRISPLKNNGDDSLSIEIGNVFKTHYVKCLQDLSDGKYNTLRIYLPSPYLEFEAIPLRDGNEIRIVLVGVDQAAFQAEQISSFLVGGGYDINKHIGHIVFNTEGHHLKEAFFYP